MNYTKIYNSLIERSLKRGLNKKKLDYYTESHHIVPKSMGGDDSRENRVLLTAREHYFAHELLFKIHRNSEMAYALIKFSKGTKEQRIVSKDYGWIKEETSKIRSETIKKFWANLSPNLKQERIKKAAKGIKKTKSLWTDEKRKEVNANIRKASVKYLESLSENEMLEYKERCSKQMKDFWSEIKSDPKKYEKYLNKLSKGLAKVEKRNCPHCGIICDVGNYGKYHGDKCKVITGVSHSREKLKCPHCSKIMDKSHAKRYHFDNCKFKKVE
ncbi:HNH endonuclease [Escherichia coli]|nr:HNH endonuclease [Escherichia coli]